MSSQIEKTASLTAPPATSAPAIAHPLAFRRDHVRSYFESSSGAPLILIQAPAGYGKTTALSFFAVEEGSSARWVRLTEHDASLDTFVASFVSAIYGWDIPKPPTPPDIREAGKWIVGAIEELNITAVILDDYDLVAQSDAVNALIEAVSEGLPPYIRIVVGSEIAPPFLKRARLRQSIVELDESDLRFDADDIARYIREVHNYEVSEEAAASIARRSGGRAAIINLVGQLSHNLPHYLRVDFEALPIGRTDEHLTVLLREVLNRAGHPPARAARDLLAADHGYENGASSTDILLEMLADRHCLVQKYAGDPVLLYPHRLLRRLAAKL